MTLSSIDVVPGRSVGPFVLHTALLEVVKHLDSHHSDYGVVNVSTNVDGGVVIESRRTGLSLTFHPQRQLLDTVIIHGLSESQLEVSYRGQVLSGESQQPTFTQVYEVLGPTFQGQLVHETSKYRLQYPGIEVEFPIPAQFHEAFSDRGTHPTRLPNGATPVADRIIVRPTASSSGLGSGSLSNTTIPVARCGKVILGDTVSFSRERRVLHFRSSGVSIPFGVFPESVVRLIGAPPSRVFTKLDNRMRIHSKGGGTDADRFEHGSLEERAPPYAFNYPLLGMDFLFNGHHHLHKVVLHNPQPSYQTYLRYHRCNYLLETALAVDPWELQRPDSRPPITSIDPDFKWTDTHKRQAAQRGAKPLISSTGCSNGLVLKIYAFYGVVLYEMPSSTKLVKVLLVDVPPGGTLSNDATAPGTRTRHEVPSTMDAMSEPVTAAAPNVPQSASDETPVSEVVDELQEEGSKSPVMRESTFANNDDERQDSTAADAAAVAPPTITTRPANGDAGPVDALRSPVPPSCDAVPGDDDDNNSGSSLAPVAEAHANDMGEDSDVVPLFSVPQPYQPLPQSETQTRGNGGEDLYEEDFVAEDGSSRQQSPQSSSVPSEVSPYLHPARSPPTELFDEPWGQQSAAAAGGEDSQDEEQDGGAHASVTLPPAAVSIKSANSSVSTTKSSSKKGKKKKR